MICGRWRYGRGWVATGVRYGFFPEWRTPQARAYGRLRTLELPQNEVRVPESRSPVRIGSVAANFFIEGNEVPATRVRGWVPVLFVIECPSTESTG